MLLIYQMNFVKKYNEYDSLNEAVHMSLVRPYFKQWEEEGGRERYKEMFDDKWRIYLDLISTDSDIYHYVEMALEDNGYYIVDYHKNIAGKEGDKRPFKIGKLLQRFSPSLKPEYDIDKDKALSTDHKIVISRHPYDIIGMTTGREWNSCMDIENGMNKRYVNEDIKQGTLIAYVIDKDDTNINKPINRLLIKPFTDKEGHTILDIDHKVYKAEGIKEISGFRDVVSTWLATKQEKKSKSLYRLNNGIYPDGKTVAMDSKVIKKISNQYPYNYPFENGTILVQNKTTHGYGVCNAFGELIIPTEYRTIEEVGDFFALHDYDYNVDIVNMKGELVIAANTAQNISYFESNIFRIKRDYKFYAFNAETGRESKGYEAIWSTGNTHLKVCENGKWALLTYDFKEITPFKYTKISYDRHMDGFIVNIGEIQGFVDREGREINVKYSYFANLGNLIFGVYHDDKVDIFNKDTHKLILKSDAMVEQLNDDTVRVKQNDKYGIIDCSTGKIVLPIIYSNIFCRGLDTLVEDNTREDGNYIGVINQKTHEIDWERKVLSDTEIKKQININEKFKKI
jgi:hypothetical protein